MESKDQTEFTQSMNSCPSYLEIKMSYTFMTSKLNLFLLLIAFFVIISIISRAIPLHENMGPAVHDSDSSSTGDAPNVDVPSETVSGTYDIFNNPNIVVHSHDISDQIDTITMNHWIDENSKRLNGLISDLNNVSTACIPTLNIGLLETNNDLFGGLSFNISNITGTLPTQTINFVLPKGRKGPVGLDGPRGDEGDVGEVGDRGDRGHDGVFTVPMSKPLPLSAKKID